MSVGAIAAQMPVSRPAVSQHLKVLAEAGLVTAEARGAARYYRIERDGLAGLRDWVMQFWDEPLTRFKAHAENKTVRKLNVRRKD
jgi:DNA-binding transcriptional ArsR family regulator